MPCARISFSCLTCSAISPHNISAFPPKLIWGMLKPGRVQEAVVGHSLVSRSTGAIQPLFDWISLGCIRRSRSVSKSNQSSIPAAGSQLNQSFVWLWLGIDRSRPSRSCILACCVSILSLSIGCSRSVGRSSWSFLKPCIHTNDAPHNIPITLMPHPVADNNACTTITS